MTKTYMRPKYLRIRHFRLWKISENEIHISHLWHDNDVTVATLIIGKYGYWNLDLLHGDKDDGYWLPPIWLEELLHIYKYFARDVEKKHRKNCLAKAVERMKENCDKYVKSTKEEDRKFNSFDEYVNKYPEDYKKLLEQWTEHFFNTTSRVKKEKNDGEI